MMASIVKPTLTAQMLAHGRHPARIWSDSTPTLRQHACHSAAKGCEGGGLDVRVSCEGGGGSRRVDVRVTV